MTKIIGKITTGELHTFLASKVQKRALGLGRSQTPQLARDAKQILVTW